MSLNLKQLLRHNLQLVLVLHQDHLRPLVGLSNHLPRLEVHGGRQLLAVRLLTSARQVKADQTHLLIKPKLPDLSIGHLGHLVQVVLGPSGDLVEGQGLCDPAPSAMHILSINSSGLNNFLSMGVYWANPRAALVRGMMVTLSRASVCCNIQPTRA